MNDRITTKKQLIQHIAERWHKQYQDNFKEWPDKYITYLTLKKLPAERTAEDIEKIIGNNSWTSLYCGECGELKDALIRLGEEPDYDSATTSICLECAKEAVKLLKEKQ